ncbi:flagellar biosynthetic protein FliR [Mangrovicoccus sp. HB161399]|uniref:flagellar biosynthetic protein FliR n=1 Tax=Mangrovicoccus sp. HB161399 TaxID=2720392 RepID=UPI0015563B55|nr:flagellar biosynthetic protein FliR [Mangrovicoccus sp. HB161399]
MSEAVNMILAMLPLEQAFLVLLRIGTAFFLLPVLGSRSVPPTVRLVLALALTYVVVPLSGAMEAGLGRSGYVAACGHEVIAGLVIGFLCRSLFWSIQIAGTMAAQSISLAQILGNQVEQPQAAIGQFLYFAALALAMALDFHVAVVKALVESYDLIPIGTAIDPGIASRLIIETLGRLFDIALGLAGPFLVIAVLYNLCLGVVNKAMPQLMVAFIGAPAISWLGLVLLLLSAPILLSVWADHLMDFSLASGLR